MIGNGLRKFGVAQGEQRHFLELPTEEEEPQAAEGEGRGKIEPAGEGASGEFWAGHPEEIDEAHENHPEGDLGEQASAALEVARQQQEKRDKEMEDENDDRHGAPAAVETRAIEGDFFGLVAGPDD